jgi:DNA end-binding protein Ku
MRSIWKGHIRFSLVTIPIRLYGAIDTAQTVRFHLVHKGCNGNIGYEKRCKKCRQVVTNDEIVKGYEYEPGQYVIIEPEDLQKLKLKSTKAIELEGFVDSTEVPLTLFESPYFIGPDGAIGAKSYSLLYEALRKSGKVGAGKVVMRDREDLVLVAPLDGCLALYNLRYPDEIRDPAQVPDVGELKSAEPDQLKLAMHLVETMSTSFAQLELKDTYQQALKELIEAKLAGREVIQVSEPERPVTDIMTALKQSLEQAKGMRKPMEKATGRRRKEEVAGKPASRTEEKKAEVAEARPARSRKRA